jgi:hypothetical protein
MCVIFFERAYGNVCIFVRKNLTEIYLTSIGKPSVNICDIFRKFLRKFI